MTWPAWIVNVVENMNGAVGSALDEPNPAEGAVSIGTGPSV
jgi:hypothetical protein